MNASARPSVSRPVPDVIATVELPGPWLHARVSAHGARFHVAEALPAGPDATGSTRPLVLLLHGFPEFWWAWRHQLPMLARAGFRAVAMDLRGYGGSDKTPRGYDPVTLSDDVAGVIAALGADSAYLVGHGWGGLVGWACAVSHQPLIKGLVASAAPHPLRMRAPGRVVGAQLSHAGHILAFQAPWFPERALLADEAALVGRLLRRWSAPSSTFPSAEEERRYRDAMRIWPAPHCALEYHRWLVRSYWRTDGRRFVGRLKQPVQVPVLQVHGAADRSVLPETARGSDRYVRAPYRWQELPDVGHFPHEEAPTALGRLLVDWLREQERAG